MPARRTERELAGYRRALRGTRDVAVGAYARRQERRRWLLAAFGMVLILGAGWLYLALRPRDGGLTGATSTVVVECVKCGYRGLMQVKVGSEEFPRQCPKCGEWSCHKLWQCRTCGHQFRNTSGKKVVTCTKCGSHAVGTARELATQPAEGEGENGR